MASRDLSKGSIDREDHPKNPGERALGHGDSMTLELADGSASGGTALDGYVSSIAEGEFVDLNEQGGVYRPSTIDDTDEPLQHEAVAKHSADLGEEVAVHLQGVIRVREYPDDADHKVLDEYPNGDYLVLLE